MSWMPCRALVVTSLVCLSRSVGTFATVSKAVAMYDDNQCSGAPFSMQVLNSSSCTRRSCSPVVFNDYTYYYETTCADATAHEIIAAAFTGTRYIVMDQFRTGNCSDDTYQQTHAVQDSNRCVPFAVDAISLASNASTIATILEDGSVNMPFFPATNCSVQPASTSTPDKTQVSTHKCYQASKFYINTNVSVVSSSSSYSRGDTSTSSSVEPQSSTAITSGQSLRGATVAGAVTVAAVLILCVVAFVVWKWRSTKRKLTLARFTDSNDSVAMLEPDDMVFMSKPLLQFSRASAPVINVQAGLSFQEQVQARHSKGQR
ncbi:hypothetical protein PRNP1_010011 [Phytophthora ramorum]